MIIDEHRHIGVCGGRAVRRADDIVQELDKLGVDHAVIAASGVAKEAALMPRDQEYSETMEQFRLMGDYFKTGQLNDQVRAYQAMTVDHGELLEAVRSTDGRLIGTWWLNPWLVDDIAKEVRAAVRGYNLRYFKLHPSTHAFAADDAPALANALELAQQLEIPVWFHTSSGPGAEFERMVTVAKLFPRVQVILGHVGSGDSEGTKHALRAAEATVAQANVWYDLSHCSARALAKVLRAANEDRLLMASDDPWGGEIRLEQMLINVRQVTADNECLRRKIMGENSAHLLRIS